MKLNDFLNVKGLTIDDFVLMSKIPRTTVVRATKGRNLSRKTAYKIRRHTGGMVTLKDMGIDE